MTITPRRYGRPTQMPDLYPGIFSSVASVRWLIFNSEQNGLAKCVRKIGKNVLIDLDEFEAWVDEKR